MFFENVWKPVIRIYLNKIFSGCEYLREIHSLLKIAD